MPTTVLLCTTWTLLLLYLSNTHQAGTGVPSYFHCHQSIQAEASMLVCLRGTPSYHWILQHNPWSLSQSTPGDPFCVFLKMTLLLLVWQPITVGRQLRGHPADCQNCAQQQLGGGNTLRIALVPVNLCKGRIFWSNMRRRRSWPEHETRSHNPASTHPRVQILLCDL